jgi:glycosyltransferase involved in cell wall biosynthesis
MPERSFSDSRPAVSIGLPVYNGQRFLAQAIESLLGQSFSDLELIISDNASSDGTPEMCEHYRQLDSRVRVFRQSSNIGAPRNWNFVVHQARGRYFKWAAANDYCDGAMLAKCVGILDQDPSAVLCYGRTCLVDDRDGTSQLYAGDISVTDDRPSDRFKRVSRDLELNNAQSGLIRLDVLKGTRLDRPYPAGDLVLMAELALAGHWRLLPEVLLYRRMGKETFSRLLSKTELRQFFDPQSSAAVSLDHWRCHLDYIGAIARARISLREKLRALRFAARHAYWDNANLRREAGALLRKWRAA